ncbi:MAG: Gfo/Idh/MocA family protein [Ilumatobacteraceae bacterium]
MASRPRVAVRGAGRMAGAFAATCRVLGWPIDSVSSRTPERAAELATTFGARAMGYDEQIAGPPPDLAIVATPPADHVVAGRAWAEAGVPVVVATPLAATLADADVLVAVADRTGTPMLLGSQPVMAPAAQELYRRVAGLHEPTHLSGRSIRPAPDWGGFLDEHWSGGVLAHPGTHHVALALLVARFVGADPLVTVSARLDGIGEGRGERSEEDKITFPSGLRAHIELAWRDDVAGSWDLQVAGADKVLRLDMADEPVLEHNGEPVALPVPPGDADVRNLTDVGLTPLLQTFWSDVEADRRPVLGMSFGRDVLEIVSAAYASAGTGGKVALPFTDPRDLTPLELYHHAVHA